MISARILAFYAAPILGYLAVCLRTHVRHDIFVLFFHSRIYICMAEEINGCLLGMVKY